MQQLRTSIMPIDVIDPITSQKSQRYYQLVKQWSYNMVL